MPPKAQPRRKPNASKDQSDAREDAHPSSLDVPSTKEPFVDDQGGRRDSQADVASAENDGLQSPSSRPQAASTPPALPRVTPSRRPVQRLASVLPRNSSNTPYNPNEESRPATLKFKPKSFIRRSKEEREAVEKAEAERQAARLAAEKGTSASDRGGNYNRGRGQGVGYGDMSRWNTSSRGASGHLGGSTLPEHGTSRRGRGGSGRGGSGSGGGGRNKDSELAGTKSGDEVKKESAVKPEKDKEGDIVMTTSTSKPKPKRTKIKKEDQAPTYVSSEGELDSDGAERVDIERINLITDDEDSGDDSPLKSEVAKGKKPQKVPQIRHDPLRPVRIQRLEHVERAVGVHTDANAKALTSDQRRRETKERNEAGGSLFIEETDEKERSHVQSSRSRRKPKDVELTSDKRKWKGVYQDEDESVKIKEEPEENDVADADISPTESEPKADAMQIDEEGATPLKQVGQTALLDRNATIENSRRAIEDNDIGMSGQSIPEDGLNVDQLTSQYLKTSYDSLVKEIEEINSLLDDFDTDISTTEPTLLTKAHDDDDPTDLKHAADVFSSSKQSYNIFQLPPLLPSLRDGARKPDPAEEKKPKRKPSNPKPAPMTNPFASDPIKPDPDIKTDPDDPLAPASKKSSIPHTYVSGGSLSLPAGQVGTLNVHKGGALSTDWGGLPMEIISNGKTLTAEELVMTKRFEKEVVKMEREDGDGMWEERERERERDEEKGFGMGQAGDWWVCVPELGGLVTYYGDD